MKGGGPAFPCKEGTDRFGTNGPGMSLRDYFAAAALQGMWARTLKGTIKDIEPLAKAAYWAADAMLAEREKK